MKYSSVDIKNAIAKTATQQLIQFIGPDAELYKTFIEEAAKGMAIYGTENAFYTPNEVLIQKIDELLSESRKHSGKLMEQVMCLAFSCLKGVTSFKSYRSVSSQYDLIVSGEQNDWKILMEYLLPKLGSEYIVAEGKNIKTRISDHQFSRLCWLLDNQMDQCYLGIFFSREGATGFPKKAGRKRQKNLADARATQVFFKAKTGKYIIVLTKTDLEELKKEGGLPRILKRKIQDLQELTGLFDFEKIKNNQGEVTIDLPNHMREVLPEYQPAQL